MPVTETEMRCKIASLLYSPEVSSERNAVALRELLPTGLWLAVVLAGLETSTSTSGAGKILTEGEVKYGSLRSPRERGGGSAPHSSTGYSAS